MPGEIEVTGDLALPNADAYTGLGEPSRLSVRNAGTTLLRQISLTPKGDGAAHVQLSLDGEEWGDAAELEQLDRGEAVEVLARSRFSPEDAEDRVDFILDVAAMSVG